MKMWVIGGTLVGLIGLSFFLAAVKRSGLTPASSEATVVAEEPAPALLPLRQVVDVTDIDPLLDPPAIPLAEPAASSPVLTRVGYEELVPALKAPENVKPIPMAKE